MLRILLLMCSAVLACSAHSGSNISVNSKESRGHALFVIVESSPENPGEKSTSTTFEAIPAPDDSTRLTDEEWDQLGLPDHGKRPSPFSPTTALHFRISNQDSVRIRMYDSKGIFVAELFDAPLEPGTHLLKILQPEDWDIPAGVYLCVVEIGVERKFAKRMLLFK